MSDTIKLSPAEGAPLVIGRAPLTKPPIERWWDQPLEPDTQRWVQIWAPADDLAAMIEDDDQ